MITQKQVEALADKLTGHGMLALTADDWPILVVAVERMSASMTFGGAMAIVDAGWNNWASKDHNGKWVRKIDGTPIQNDLKVNIAEAVAALAMPVSTDC